VHELRNRFADVFGRAPSRVARAPGRVNLIGEHIDYLGFPVLPMALDRAIDIAFAPRDDATLRVVNVDPQHPPVEFTVSTSIDRDAPGAWGNYLRAAAQGMARQYGVTRGIEGAVRSDLPVAAGLSSSAALVVATALALLSASEREVPPLELADVLAEAERYVGTKGGGMDQAISLGAKAGHAGHVHFDPLRLDPVPIPSHWVFVVAFTGMAAPKSGAAREAYNRRTEECREALHAVTAELGLGSIGYPELLQSVEPERLTAAEQTLPDTLARRFRHVTGEARRVAAAVETLRGDDRDRFGTLMADSHRSLKDDYEVSTAELDALVDAAMAGGAVGARLTGAGFGGSIVALCEAGTEVAVLDALEREYYAPRGLMAVRESAAFVAVAAGGAEVSSM
jgi:galactokinase